MNILYYLSIASSSYLIAMQSPPHFITKKNPAYTTYIIVDSEKIVTIIQPYSSEMGGTVLYKNTDLREALPPNTLARIIANFPINSKKEE